jgi:hypothetical protein
VTLSPTILTVAISAGLLCLAAPHALAWSHVVNGDADRTDGARIVAVDGAGDVVAGGWIETGQQGGVARSATVVKLASADGAELWRWPAVPGEPGQVNLLSVDAAGDVVVGVGDRFTVVKLAGSDGGEIWRAEVSGTVGADDRIRALVVGATGDVVAAGTTRNHATGFDFTVVKLSAADGQELWRREIDGADGMDDVASAVAIDDSGKIVVAGRFETAADGPLFFVTKLSSGNGSEVWSEEVASGEARAVAIDLARDVVVCGTLSGDFAVVKLERNSGSVVWQKTVSGTRDDGDDAATSVAVDSNGDVVAVGGLLNLTSNRDGHVVKLSGADGDVVWDESIVGTFPAAAGSDAAIAVTIDDGGDVAIAGRRVHEGNDLAFGVTKLRGVDGGRLWATDLSAAAGSTQQANAVAFDPYGHVLAAGSLHDPGVGDDFVVVKLAGPSGRDYLSNCRQDIDSDDDGFGECDDCDDGDDRTFPGAPQLCDGLNNDCADGSWPDTAGTNEADSDQDGFSQCTGDCDDADPTRGPGAVESCNGIDDDCDNLIDEDGLGEDTDGDGIHNVCDNCPGAPNPAQADGDDDTVGDLCDNCVSAPNPDQAELDGDELGDACDNCPGQFNPAQENSDTDELGDACDNCPFVVNRDQVDLDGDFEGNLCDLDDGMIFARFVNPTELSWQAESGYQSWNLYRGDYAAFMLTGEYTQQPGSNAFADQDCGMANTEAIDFAGDPLPREMAFYLVSGNAAGLEDGLGEDSAGTPRSNDHPCP